ncbi:MAG: glycosyltransferase family 4 protein [Hyphomicrobiaceae bacterium]
MAELIASPIQPRSQDDRFGSGRGGPAGLSVLDRVVIINDDCVNSGGAAAVAILSAKILRSMGLSVTFATGDLSGREELLDLGVDIVTLGGRHLLEGARTFAAVRGLYDQATRSALASWIQANDTPGTIYHLHNWHKVLSPSVFSPLSGIGGRLALTLHDFFLVCPNGGFFDFQAGKVCERRPLSRDCLMTSCDKRSVTHKAWRTVRHLVRQHILDVSTTEATIVVVHDGMRDLLALSGISNHAITTVRNPVTPWQSRRIEAERNRGFLFVGRLESDKGIHVLAEAARAARADLTVIGDGPLRHELEKKYPQITFLGRMRPDEIAVEAKRARAVVVPSLVRETFGLVVLEAAASGLPVIVSQSACIAREVEENGMGLVCPAGNALALSRTLESLRDDDARIASLSRAAFTNARRLIATPAEWGEQLVELYEKMLLPAASRRTHEVTDAAVPASHHAVEAGS